jgi:signal peptidase I
MRVSAVDEDLPAASRSRRFWRFVRDVMVITLVLLLLAWVSKVFFIRVFSIPSASMSATLQIGDRVMVNQLQAGEGSFSRGDVVVFRDSQDWVPDVPAAPKNPVESVLETLRIVDAPEEQYVIKRVVGLPGDHVVCCDAQLRVSVNGVPITEPYLRDPQLGSSFGLPFDVVVPEGAVWVMGDNRQNSSDSRRHQGQPGRGFVPISDVVGTAIAVTWPIRDWRTLGETRAFGEVPSTTPVATK